MLRTQQVAEPDALTETLSAAVAEIGGHDVVLYLIDYEHVALMPHPDALPHGEQPQVHAVDGSMAGRAFLSSTALAAEREDGWHVWVPVTERANRLGVLAMTLAHWDEDTERACSELGLAAAYLVMASANYTDLPHLLRRRKDMDLAAEMQWFLLPPLSFSTGGATLSGLLEPAYEVGGDCFDYAVNNGVLDIAVFDTVGHGLTSAVLASLLVGAYRHARRGEEDLAEIARSIDSAARTFPGQPAFATAVLAQLQIATGRLTWMTCGHPRPIFVRRGSALQPMAITPGLPLGLGALGAVVGEIVETSLEPGDGVLFYTDGVTEARGSADDYFGEDRLRDLLPREHLAGGEPQDVIRRLARSVVAHSGTRLRDDATLLYLRWDGLAADPA